MLLKRIPLAGRLKGRRPHAGRRRQRGAAVMACIGLAALIRLRVVSESYTFLAWEIATIVSIVAVIIGAWLFRNGGLSKVDFAMVPKSVRYLLITLVTLGPWLSLAALRWMNQGTGIELIMMSSLSWCALATTLWPPTSRALNISVVCSGFLVLFVTCSSDQSVAIFYAYAWGVCCLWWLVANHWEEVKGCQASVQVESLWYRPISIVCGIFVFALAVWFVSGHAPGSNRLQWEWMPTSGGTSQRGIGARSGVGDGDDVVAAQRQVASFAAVESEVFLDSDEPSLFDVFSEALGEPVKRNRTERSVALSAINEETSSSKAAESKGNTASFSLQRRAPNPVQPTENVASEAVLRWVGRSGVLLALERFTDFDGLEWSAPAKHSQPGSSNRHIEGHQTESHHWCSPNDLPETSSTIFVGARNEAVKFMGLRTPRIPAPAGYHSWCISQVEDATMFGVDALDCLWMPGRERVPDFTVVNFINREMDLGKITSHVNRLTGISGTEARAQISDEQRIEDELLGTVDGDLSNWEQVQGLISKLRNEFEFDRTINLEDCEHPVAKFFEDRKGNDLQFATVAALALRKLGYQTRLVTGFAVSAERRIGITDEYHVLPRDAHVWLELYAGLGSWIPLEPTPGYPVPQYHISWQHWLSQSAGNIFLGTAASSLIIALIFWQRLLWFDLVCWVMQFSLWLATDRQRARWLVKVMDWRYRLAGYQRPKHQLPRKWLQQVLNQDGALSAQSNEWQRLANQFFGEADRIWFGAAQQMTDAGRHACFELWRGLTGTRLQHYLKQKIGRTN